MMRGTDLIREKDYLTDAFTREAVSFIDRHRDNPFFLLLAYNAPHAPLEASDKYMKRVEGVTGGDQRRRVYAAMIEALDDGVGAVTAKLKDAGLAQDTLVFFMGDNGGITGYLSPSSNMPLSGAKTELLEGGVRVPFIVNWPGHITGGRTYSQPVSVIDVFPTAAALAGAKAPAAPLDGVDLMPFLSGKTDAAPHATLYWRYGTQKAVREGPYKLLDIGKGSSQLYDLSADVSERRNLAAQKPEIVKHLTDELKSWDSQLVPPAWNKPNNVPTW
jgi:arylsulfatase A-like enzyme